MKRSTTVSLLAASFGFAVSLPAAAADSDAEFVKKAASAGMMEVALGKHAQTHGEHPDVRAFGKRMVDDHTKAARELEQVAMGEGIAVPKAMSEHDREETDELVAKRGAEFDDDYMDDMVDGHEEVMLISTGGVLIRMAVSQIREQGRSTQGVTLIALGEGEKLAGMERIEERDLGNGNGGNGENHDEVPPPPETPPPTVH